MSQQSLIFSILSEGRKTLRLLRKERKIQKASLISKEEVNDREWHGHLHVLQDTEEPAGDHVPSGLRPRCFDSSSQRALWRPIVVKLGNEL